MPPRLELECVLLHPPALVGVGHTLTSDPGSGIELARTAVRTAFGEGVSLADGPATRYGYAGGWGYEEHDQASPAGFATPDGIPDNIYRASPTRGFPFQHLGARYYRSRSRTVPGAHRGLR
ncbi:MAG TPA: hypothetical protein VGA66_03385 [Mycobacterium sp.]